MDFLNAFLKRNWSLVLNGVLLLTLIGTTGYFLMQDDKEEIVETEGLSYAPEEVVSSKIYVDVKGAVKKTGVYEMDSDAIINDVITEAGGFTSKAYINNINLSKKISDEMVIYVYTKSEYQKLNEVTKVEQVTCNCEDYVIDSCTNEGSSVITPSEGSTPKLEIDDNTTENTTNNKQEEHKTSKVSINTATKEELMTLNGIGESKADNIIKYREKNNGFKTIEEIKNVSGIGEAVYEKIKDSITV